MAADPVTVTLAAEMAEQARRFVESGRYDTVSDVVDEGLRALDREEAAFDELVRIKVAEALADPRPPIPFDEAMAQVWAVIERKRT